jgi:hypothetical protein
MAETLKIAIDRLKPPSDEWKKGPKITKEDLKYGKGNIEFISGLEGGSNKKFEVKNSALPHKTGFRMPVKTSPKQSSSPIMNFGKYRDKPMKWVMENDSEYWQWCIENITNFEDRAIKANLV